MKTLLNLKTALLTCLVTVTAPAMAVDFSHNWSTSTSQSKTTGTQHVTGKRVEVERTTINGYKSDYKLPSNPCTDCGTQGGDLNGYVVIGDMAQSSKAVTAVNVLNHIEVDTNAVNCDVSIDLAGVTIGAGQGSATSKENITSRDTSVTNTTGKATFTGDIYKDNVKTGSYFNKKTYNENRKGNLTTTTNRTTKSYNRSSYIGG